jgi:hypothetical protein
MGGLEELCCGDIEDEGPTRDLVAPELEAGTGSRCAGARGRHAPPPPTVGGEDRAAPLNSLAATLELACRRG